MSNAFVASPSLEVELDRKRKFCLDLNAFCELEKRLGKSLFKVINWNDTGFNDMRLLLWAGLLSDDPTLSFEDFNKMMSVPQLMKLMPLVMDMLGRSLPQSDSAAQEGEPKKELPATTSNPQS